MEDRKNGRIFGYARVSSKEQTLDRLSRSKQDIKTELQWFKENGVRLMVLDMPTTMVD